MADVVVNSDNSNPKELLGQGIRAYILQDYNSAVTALSKASELLVAEHGDDLHDSLADVYLYYGKALLGLSREETEALGDAVRNKDESDEEEDEVENAEAEEGTEKEEADGAKANGTTDSNVDTTTDNAEQKVESNDSVKEGEPSSNGSAKEGEPSGSMAADSSDDKPENEEETTDLQVAWEVLELAKKIYQKRGEVGKKNLAETLVILGEVSLESENFESAINDIKEGLGMQKELFPNDSRTVAETYYKLGVAYSTNTQIDEAVESFKQSLEYLKNRVSSLEKIEEKKDGVEEEINEIKGLVPDIEEKIADMKSYKDEVCQCDIRTTIREFVGKPKFGEVHDSTVNKIQVKRKRSLEAALDKVHI